MESKIEDLVIKYNYILSILRDSYKNQCSEIGIKLSALNLSCTPYEIDMKHFKNEIEQYSSYCDLETTLIAVSLYKSIIKNQDSMKVDEITSKYQQESLKGVYSVIFSLILYCSSKDYASALIDFNTLSEILSHNHPVANAFEYSPFILLSSLKDSTPDEIVKSTQNMYNSLHSSGFAGGTNTYCTALYLSAVSSNIDTGCIRKIYTSLKPLIPCNQFNYLDCAELYIFDNNFSDYETIIKIYNKISNTGGAKWFSEQLDVSTAVGIFICAMYGNVLPQLKFNADCRISANLLTSMIASTLLLNSSI